MKGIIVKITTVKDSTEKNGLNVLLYGPSSVGKTASVASLVTAGFKPLLISAENGLYTLSVMENGKQIPVIDLTKDDEGKKIPMSKRIIKLDQVHAWLEKEKPKEFDTIVIDSLTEVNQALMSYLHEKHPAEKDALKKYRDNNDIMRKLIKDFRDLHYNVVFISQSEVEKDDVGRRFTQPSIIGKLAQDLPYFFDFVFCMKIITDEKGIEKRIFQCDLSTDTMAKNRGGLLNKFEQANLGEIFTKLKALKVKGE